MNLDKTDIVTPTATALPPFTKFGDTALVQLTRPVSWQNMPLPQKLEDWQVELDPNTATFTIGETAEANDSLTLLADFSEPVEARLFGQAVPVQPGQLFRMTARVRGISEGFYDFSPALRMQFFNAQGSTISHTGAQTLLPADAEGWYTLVLDGVVPPHAANARPVIEFSDYSLQYAPHVEIKNVEWQMEQLAAP